MKFSSNWSCFYLKVSLFTYISLFNCFHKIEIEIVLEIENHLELKMCLETQILFINILN